MVAGGDDMTDHCRCDAIIVIVRGACLVASVTVNVLILFPGDAIRCSTCWTWCWKALLSIDV